MYLRKLTAHKVLVVKLFGDNKQLNACIFVYMQKMGGKYGIKAKT